jgi:hypothetical protein
MRIEGTTTALRQALLAALPAAGEAFRKASATADLGLPATPPPIPLQATPATSVQMLVALAAIDSAVEKRRKAAVQADRGLTLLEQLDAAIAAGEAVEPAQMAALADWAADFARPDDPLLAPIAEAIELRVRVELARYDRLV